MLHMVSLQRNFTYDVFPRTLAHLPGVLNGDNIITLRRRIGSIVTRNDPDTHRMRNPRPLMDHILIIIGHLRVL